MHRWLASLAFGLALTASAPGPAAAAPPRVVVLDFEQTGDLGDAGMIEQRRARMGRMAAELKRRLAASGVVEVVDDRPARDLIERLRGAQYLHRCNGCELDIARALSADAVLVPWLFRMSQLVVTLHVEMRDAATGDILMKRALDFRNDADESWSRTIDYLVRDMREGRWWNGAPSGAPLPGGPALAGAGSGA